MSDKQRFLIYAKLGYLIASVKNKNDTCICGAVKILLEKGIIQKLEDLETGYYLESGAYLAETFKIA